MAWNKLSTYKTRIGAENGFNYVQYHSTRIAQWNDSTIILDTGGWCSVTTRRKLNQASHQFGLQFSVYQRDFVWYVVTPQGQTIEWNGERIELSRIVAPSISPEQSEYDRDLALRIKAGQIGSGMRVR